MPEKITAENILGNIVETIADNVQHKKSVSFFEEDSSSVSARFNRLFGRQKPVHHILGGGKCRLFQSLHLHYPYFAIFSHFYHK